MTYFDLVVLALATFYCANAVTRLTGPFKVFWRLRERFPLGGLTTCIHCAVPYLAALLYGVYLVVPVVVYILAVGSLALMLGAYSQVKHV